MARGKGYQILSESELATLKEERREVQETLSTLEGNKTEKYGEGTRAQSIDKAALMRQDKVLRDAIDKGSPKKISGYDKDRMAKEASELEDKIKQNMPSYDEMQDLRRNPGADRKELNWQRNNAANVMRWREIQRQLNPGDPTSGNIERLRKR